jgi:hypothetical protein
MVALGGEVPAFFLGFISMGSVDTFLVMVALGGEVPVFFFGFTSIGFG